jgi:hypothetical protein
MADGYYEFINLAAGDYYVIIATPSDSEVTLPNIGDELNDSDITGSQAAGSSDIVTIGLGITPFTTDGGYYFNGSIGNRTWYDFKMDGLFDDEAGVSFVDVNLRRADGTLVATTFTDFMPGLGDGFYMLQDVTPGEYYIEFVNFDGYQYTFSDQGSDDMLDSDVTGAFGLGTTDLFVLLSGQDRDDIDAGLAFPPGSVGDFVWADENTNGLQDSGEPGIPNVAVSIFNAATDELIGSTLTGLDGRYTIPNIQPGTYYMEFDRPQGFLNTIVNGSDASLNSDVTDFALNRTDNFMVGFATDVVDIDAGFFQPSSLGDFVWEDLNENGLQDAGEPGVAGVVVELFRNLPFPIMTTTTDANGRYSFTDLTPGLYSLAFELPMGFEFTTSNVGNDESIDSDVNAAGTTALILLAYNVNLDDRDAGIRPISGNRVISTIWEDLNQDGIRDADEPRMAGVEVMVMDHQGTMMEMLMTDSHGLVSYEVDQTDGTSIRVLPPAGYVFTSQDMGSDDSVDSDVDADGYSNLMAPNSSTRDVDAGVVAIGGLVVDVWHDADADGIKDAMEPGLAGVEVSLVNRAGDIAMTGVSRLIAGGHAAVVFDNLPLGDYRITVDYQDDMVVTRQRSADQAFYFDGLGAATDWISLTVGSASRDLDLGMYHGGTIESTVWTDKDNDGQRDAIESGKRAIYATLVDVETRRQVTTITNGDGIARWSGLQRGEYFVNYYSTEGLVFTTADRGDDQTDSDVTGANGLGTTDTYLIPHNYTTVHIAAGLAVENDIADSQQLMVARSQDETVAVRMYPNPAQDYLTIETDQADTVSDYAYVIYTASGERVQEGTTKSGELLDISNLQPGLYSVGVEINGDIQVQLIIKM